MLLDAWTLKERVFIDQVKKLGSGTLLGMQAKYEGFFYDTYHYLTSENFIFVHAGFDFGQTDPFLDRERMMMTREFDYHAGKSEGRTIVRGHYPMQLDAIQKSIVNREKIVSLDNGCVYSHREGMGNLLALELNSNKLVVQKNVD
jgi:serine/threonine protein phosphatase 1